MDKLVIKIFRMAEGLFGLKDSTEFSAGCQETSPVPEFAHRGTGTMKNQYSRGYDLGIKS